MAGDLLSPRELRRYSKQIMLPEIGTAGQEKLKKVSVLVVGAGGLGCPALQYLAAAGVGQLGIVEFDIVDDENLPRQILYGSEDLGKLKSIIAKSRLEQLNTLVRIEVFNLKLDASNSLKIMKNYDIIVDATDNMHTKYVINDSCVILNKPMVYGAISNFEGHVSVFNYMEGPTYRCYNPYSNTRHNSNPDPAGTGLFGVLAGITGTIMANEVIQIIIGKDPYLSGKILKFNIKNYSFRIVRINVNPENHNIKELNDLPGIK
jgi:molybdopterin/thiamine biosynthesis adenylyltransferase